MDAYGVRRKDTTKGPPLRVLSLGKTLPLPSCSLLLDLLLRPGSSRDAS